jgi:GntR family transcriptional regulator
MVADVTRRLAAGELAAGVPPERELIAEYGVSRHTVRYAIGRLQSAGIIERGRGKGSFVRPPAIEQPTGMLCSLFRSVEEHGFVQRSIVLDLRTISDPAIAEKLDLKPKARIVYLRRVRFADDTPLAVDELWLPYCSGGGAPVTSVETPRSSCNRRPAGRSPRHDEAVPRRRVSHEPRPAERPIRDRSARRRDRRLCGVRYLSTDTAEIKRHVGESDLAWDRAREASSRRA